MNLQLPDNVKQELIKLVPASIINDIACFVFYDNHPRDEKYIDVIICTVGGELIEYYKREAVCSHNLNIIHHPSEVTILRNANCQLFYLVTAADELLILSRKDDICNYRRITNVDKYDIEDSACRGQACLKVVCKDDAVPMIFDDNLENLGDKALVFGGIHADDTLPLLTQLMRKLSEAKYSVKCNEKTLNDFLKLRQMSALSLYQKNCSNVEEATFKSNSMDLHGNKALDIKTNIPWVKICNGQIIIMITFVYNTDETLEDIQTLLQGTGRVTMVYTTKIFEKIDSPPFWEEKTEKSIKSTKKELAITAVVDLEEMKYVITNKIEFNGAISYKKAEIEYLVPFDHVYISGEEILGEEYNALICGDLDVKTCLALLASTSKTEMIFRHLRKDGEETKYMPELFCTYLHMEKINNTNNVVIYRNSHYHILNGIMLYFEVDQKNGDVYNVSVHTRSSTQITMLMYCVYQTIPHQIVMTTKNQKITTKLESLSQYNEEIAIQPSSINYEGYASSLLQQCDIIIEYLDNCMIKMSESKDAEVKAKIGAEIDIFAQGVPAFIEFRQKLLEKASIGIQLFNKTDLEAEQMATE